MVHNFPSLKVRVPRRVPARPRLLGDQPQLRPTEPAAATARAAAATPSARRAPPAAAAATADVERREQRGHQQQQGVLHAVQQQQQQRAEAVDLLSCQVSREGMSPQIRRLQS